MCTAGKDVSLVAFIDILGFSDRECAIRDKKEFMGLLKDVRLVHEQFERHPQSSIVREGHELANKEVLAFSDCLVVSVPLKSTIMELQGSFDGFMVEILMLALSQGECVLSGVFLRGGLDLGPWFHDGDVLASPAHVRAYKLEQRVSVPVLALSEELYQFFAAHPGRRVYSEDTDPISSFREYVSEGFSCYFIDYLSLCIGEIDWHVDAATLQKYRSATDDEEKIMIMAEGRERNVRRWLLQHKKAILAAKQAAHSMSVSRKYAWLTSYHNDVIHELCPQFEDCLLPE